MSILIPLLAGIALLLLVAAIFAIIIHSIAPGYRDLRNFPGPDHKK